MVGIYINHSSLISFIYLHASFRVVKKLVKDTNAFLCFDRFIDCLNMGIYKFVTKVYKSHKNIKFNKYGYYSSKNAADST